MRATGPTNVDGRPHAAAFREFGSRVDNAIGGRCRLSLRYDFLPAFAMRSGRRSRVILSRSAWRHSAMRL